jgi:hypothetical protein
MNFVYREDIGLLQALFVPGENRCREFLRAPAGGGDFKTEGARRCWHPDGDGSTEGMQSFTVE